MIEAQEACDEARSVSLGSKPHVSSLGRSNGLGRLRHRPFEQCATPGVR